MTPLLRRSRAVAFWRTIGVESDDGILLGLALVHLDLHGVRYKLPVRLHGLELLQAAVNSGRGVLLAGVHQRIVHLSPGVLVDAGFAPIVVSVASPYPLFGTGQSLVADAASKSMLLDAKQLLESGGLLWALLDRPCAERRTQPVQTDIGCAHVADALFRVALRTDAHVLFLMSRVDKRGTLHFDITSPAHDVARTPGELFDQFARTISASVRAQRTNQ